MWISLRGLAGEGGGSGGVGNCVSMKVQVSQSWNKQITCTVLPLPFTLSGVTTTFLEGVGGSHCLHILMAFLLPSICLCFSSLFGNCSLQGHQWTSGKKLRRCLLLRLLFFDVILPTPLYPPPTPSFLDLCEVFFNPFLLLNYVLNFRLPILS